LHMCGKCRLGAQMSLQHNFCVAQNATTHSENTHRHCAFKGEVLTAVLKLRERGFSEAYLQTMMRALLDYICDVDGVKLFRKRK
jgi:hypothetical protein